MIGIAVVLVLGIQALRRMTAPKTQCASSGTLSRACRGWLTARRQSALSALSARPSGTDGGEQSVRIADLERLADLHHRGDLTDEEFRAHKAALLTPHS